MSEYDVEYCPWCAGEVSQTIEQNGHNSYVAKKCGDCETVFRVVVPHRDTKIKWSNAT